MMRVRAGGSRAPGLDPPKPRYPGKGTAAQAPKPRYRASLANRNSPKAQYRIIIAPKEGTASADFAYDGTVKDYQARLLGFIERSV